MAGVSNVDLMFDFFDRLGFVWSLSDSPPDQAIESGLYVPDDYEFAFHNKIPDTASDFENWMYVNGEQSDKEDWMEIFENKGHYRDSYTNEVMQRKPMGESHNVVGATYWEPKPDRAAFYRGEIYASMGIGNNKGIYIWSGWIAFITPEGGVGSGGPIDRLIKTRMEVQAKGNYQFHPQYSNMVLVEFPTDSAENDRTIYPLKESTYGTMTYGEEAFRRYSTLVSPKQIGYPDAINRWTL